MRRLALALSVAALVLTASAPAPAQAAFGLKGLDLTFTDATGAPSMQAGTHPLPATNSGAAITKAHPKTGKAIPADGTNDIAITYPARPGGDQTPLPHVPIPQLLN